MRINRNKYQQPTTNYTLLEVVDFCNEIQTLLIKFLVNEPLETREEWLQIFIEEKDFFVKKIQWLSEEEIAEIKIADIDWYYQYPELPSKIVEEWLSR